VAEPAQEPRPILATSHERGRAFTIALSGEWDLYNRPELDEALAAARASGESLVVLDLSRATFIDSSVLGALVETRKQMNGTGSIAIVAADRQIRKVFEITGLDSVFTLHESLDELHPN
jgi:anti-sigma B factor antagonist